MYYVQALFQMLEQFTEQNRQKQPKSPSLKKLHPSGGIEAVNTTYVKTSDKYNKHINVEIDKFNGENRVSQGK